MKTRLLLCSEKFQAQSLQLSAGERILLLRRLFDSSVCDQLRSQMEAPGKTARASRNKPGKARAIIRKLVVESESGGLISALLKG